MTLPHRLQTTKIAKNIPAILIGILAVTAAGSAIAQPDTSGAVIDRRFGSFADATAFSISADNKICVIDGETGDLIMLSADGDTDRKLNGKGWGELGFDQPDDVDATQTIRVYVADYGNHRIQVFDRNFNFISTLDGQIPSENSFEFRYPKSVAVSRHNDIFVLDADNARIVKFDPSGTLTKAFGGFDAGKGRLEDPSRMRMSTRDLLGIIDGTDLVFFDLYGNYLTRFRNSERITACAPAGSSPYWLIASAGRLMTVETDESGCRLVGPLEIRNDDGTPGNLGQIRDIAVSDRNLFILTDHDIVRSVLTSRGREGVH